MKKILNNISGQGLLEIILAVAIFALLASTMISLSLGGNMAILQGGEQMRAQSLADEALEAVRSVGGRAWNELKYNKSAVATSSNQWILSGEGTDETLGSYNRKIEFTDVCRDSLHNISNCPASYTDQNTKKVTVTITWQVRPGVNGSIVREAYVTNWDSRDWTQTDWSGGPGQNILTADNKYSTDDGHLDYSYPGEIRLASVSNGNCGVQTWNFSTAGHYIYDSGIEIAGGYAQLVSQDGAYPTSKPTIQPSTSYVVNQISSWTSFSEVAVKNGSSQIYYQLSSDNGSTWMYWNGTSWGVANSTSYNLATDINAHIGTFATTTAQIMFKAFLASNGTDQVRLDSVTIGCAQEYNWPFDSASLYSYNNQKIEVSSSAAKLLGSSGAGSSLDPGFSLGLSSSYNWPFDLPSDYAYDTGRITVASSLASLVGTNNNTFRVTQYYLGVGSFSGTTYNLMLNQNLSQNYFVILQGSDGDGTASNDRGANVDYASLVSDPWGTGDLNVSGANNVIGLYRAGATNSWVGVVTVVECLSDCSASGFTLLGAKRVVHSGTTTTGTATADTAWSNINQIMLMGGYNGSGCDTTGTNVKHHNACQNRIYPSGTNTINWVRNATGGTLTTANSTVMVVQWGSGWKVQRVNVVGSAGGTGANLASYYNTAAISSVVRADTWVWGTGWVAAAGVGNGSEGVLITLGNGVTKNANETTVAVGAMYAVSRSFDVYALTNANLNVDYQFKANADSGVLTYDQTVAAAASPYNRMALTYNGCAGTTTTFPQSIFSARYYTDTSVRLERRRSGQTFPAWTEGIDFSGIYAPTSYPTDKPNIYPVSSYSPSSVQNWSGFTETATKNTGEIYYQLSGDNGSTWKYWDGSAWSTASLATNYNTASVVNTNINKFATSTNQLKFNAFLSSAGTQNVQLDNVNVAYSQAASPWSFYTWDVGAGEVTPTGKLVSSGGNPGQFAEVDMALSSSDQIGGYWQQTIPISTNNPQVSINFDYKSILFSAAPTLAQVRVYLDSTTGTPTNQVASFNLTGTTAWLNSGTIDASSAVTSSGTYYLKVAFWLSSANNNASYSVGFDNVNLSWSGTGYPSDSPSIQPTSAYSISNLDHYTGFYETATKNTNTEIYYQLSNDNGATWQYWNGLVWGLAGPANYNTAAVVNSNILNFATTTGSIIFKAFLQSDGLNQVSLDNVRISWNEPGQSGEQSQTYGEFTSSAYDMTDASPVQILEWQESVPTNTSLKLQIRTAADSSGSPGVWSSWYGANGANTYFTGAKQYLLSTDLNGRRWVQYRAEFAGDGSDTPVLYNVKINYR